MHHLYKTIVFIKIYQPVSSEYTSSSAVPTELIPPWIKIFFPTHAAAWAVLDEGIWPVGSSLLQVLFTINVERGKFGFIQTKTYSCAFYFLVCITTERHAE